MSFHVRFQPDVHLAEKKPKVCFILDSGGETGGETGGEAGGPPQPKLNIFLSSCVIIFHFCDIIWSNYDKYSTKAQLSSMKLVLMFFL